MPSPDVALDVAPDVTFVLPGVRATGGVRAVFELVDRLRTRGHETLLVVPERSLLAPHRSIVGMAQRFGPRWLDALTQRIAPARVIEQDWFPLHTPIRVAGPDLVAALPETGAIVTTSYRTAETLLGWGERSMRGASLIQGEETWDGPARRVHRSWRGFSRHVVTSPRLAQRLEEVTGSVPVLAPYGVDLAMFSPSNEPGVGHVVVGFHRDDRTFKGTQVVLDSIAALRDEGRDVVGRCFGLGTGPLPPWVDDRGAVSGDELAAFYRGLGLFVCASTDESGPMTIPEAMASGVAVVSTEVGCVPLWAGGDRRTIFIVPSSDPGRVVDGMRALLAEPEERQRLASAGHDAIRSFGWDEMTGIVEGALKGWGLLR